MRLRIDPALTVFLPWNYGGPSARALIFLHRVTLLAVLAVLALPLATPACAQQANQPGFDPRQTEKHFEDLESRQARPAKPPLRLPSMARPEASADTGPQFVLRTVSLVGVSALPRDQLAAAYRPYLGNKVSQADLVTIAQAIGDLYRAAGFHWRRAIIPPQDIADLALFLASDAARGIHGEALDIYGTQQIYALEDFRARQVKKS